MLFMAECIGFVKPRRLRNVASRASADVSQVTINAALAFDRWLANLESHIATTQE
jgi:hypothetical protein